MSPNHNAYLELIGFYIATHAKVLPHAQLQQQLPQHTGGEKQVQILLLLFQCDDHYDRQHKP